MSQYNGDDAATQRQELLDMIQTALSHPLDQLTFESLLQIQSEMRDRQSALVTELEGKQITPEGYLDRLNDLMVVSMERIRALLGDECFMKIYGEAGLHPEGLVDRDTFLRRQQDGGQPFPQP